MMHTCPRCGYEPLPEPYTRPEIYQPAWSSKWTVRVWTHESDHAWVKDDFPTKEAAEAFVKEVMANLARLKRELEEEEAEDFRTEVMSKLKIERDN